MTAIFIFVLLLPPVFGQTEQPAPTEAPPSGEAPLTPEEEEKQRELELKVMLFNAIMDEDYTHVQQLLAKKAPVNITDSQGFTPLHYAVCFNQLNITKLLINNRANLDCRDIEGYTPIYYAAQNKSEEIFNLLLRRGASTAATEKTTLLHMAAYGGNINIIKSLLERKLSTVAKDDQNLLPIDYSAAAGHDEAVLLLADNMPEEEISLNTLLPLLVGEKKELLKNLFGRIKDKNRFNTDKDSPARIIAQYSTADMMAFLEEQGVDITYVSPQGNSALQEAAAAGNLEVLKLLIEKGMDINAPVASTGFTPIMTACCSDNSDIVKYLASRGAKTDVPSAKGTYLIHEAAYRGNLELVMFLAENGTDINLPDSDGVTPLYNALDANQPGVADWLLKRGANTKLKTKNGDTCLHFAVLSDNERLFREMIPSLKSLVGKANNNGVTPILDAFMIGNLPIVFALQAVGAKLDDTDNDGNTALHYGVLSNKKQIVEFLLSKGADPLKANASGETPLSVAEKNKFTAIAELLKPKQEEQPETPPEEAQQGEAAPAETPQPEPPPAENAGAPSPA
ncbi:MAG: ankyrin repeat domain-containing protein [Abditibacteriota bacterium]|nr:ankyrin repeat domain-containing protein [Abditibacteriota bacterium]